MRWQESVPVASKVESDATETKQKEGKVKEGKHADESSKDVKTEKKLAYRFTFTLQDFSKEYSERPGDVRELCALKGVTLELKSRSRDGASSESADTFGASQICSSR